MTSGFRWAFWMAPLWLMAMQPAADWASRRRWSQILAAVLLGHLGPVGELSDLESLDATVAVGCA